MNHPSNVRAPRPATEPPGHPQIGPGPLPGPPHGARRTSGPPPLPSAARSKRPAAPRALIRKIRPAPPTVAPADPESEDTRRLLRVPLEFLDRIQWLLERIAYFDPAATPAQVASACAVAVRTTLEAKAVVIHAHEPGARAIRVVSADGPSAEQLLGDVASTEDDLVASSVISNGTPTTVRCDDELPRFMPLRLRWLGVSRTIAALPISSAAGCVAIVELVDVDPRYEPMVTNVWGMVRAPLVRALAREARP